MITTVTLNAAIDKAYQMAVPVEGGTVMRVANVVNSAGGKGLNVARIATRCGEKAKATGFVGGFNGQYLEDMLTKDGVEHAFTHTQAETRSCINILDERFSSTEFLEPGLPVTDEEVKSFLDSFAEVIKESDVVAMSGSAPKGVPADIYAKLVEIIKASGKKALVDTSGAYLEAAIPSKPFMIKPNRDELEMLYNTKINSIEETIPYAKKLHEDGIDYVVISLGGDGALLVCDEGIFQGKPPKMEIVNTVGCGDSMVGGFAVGISRGYSAKDTLKYAVAVASANALEAKTGDIKPENRDKILEQVEIIEMA